MSDFQEDRWQFLFYQLLCCVIVMCLFNDYGSWLHCQLLIIIESANLLRCVTPASSSSLMMMMLFRCRSESYHSSSYISLTKCSFFHLFRHSVSLSNLLLFLQHILSVRPKSTLSCSRDEWRKTASFLLSSQTLTFQFHANWLQIKQIDKRVLLKRHALTLLFETHCCFRRQSSWHL